MTDEAISGREARLQRKSGDGKRGTGEGAITGGPAIILVRPQLGENIGTAARAMLNCGLTDMRIVDPRDGWPNEKALAASSGATFVIDNAKVTDTTADAIADLHYVVATTARSRDMVKPVLTQTGMADALRRRWQAGEKVGILFGGEKSGLDNEDVSQADAIVTVPLNPRFSSLNLAQAVLLIGHAWFMSGDDTAAFQSHTDPSEAATHEALNNLYARFEDELARRGFYQSEEQRPTVIRNMRNMFNRAGLTDQEVRTLHGMISALTRGERYRSRYESGGDAAE